MDAGMSLTLLVQAASAEDAGRGIARLPAQHLAALGARAGAMLALSGERTAYARALPLRGPGAESSDGATQGVVQIDAATRDNARLRLGDRVRVRLHGQAGIAGRLELAGPDFVAAAPLARLLAGVPLCTGDRVRLKLVNGQDAELKVTALAPEGPCLIGETTELRYVARSAPPGAEAPRYEDLGGLSRAVERVREVVELPLRHRDAFLHLGIAPPRGVLLVGPPGTGKTLLARAVAAETQAHFITINAPEIVDKYYGASEQQLRQLFETARKRAPCIIFIDEIDAIAQKRDALSGEKQVERRIVAQLLTLMDGLAGRGEVMVLAATNLAECIDPALRRPGRFDREIRIDPPDRAGRHEILAIHTRAMPLAPDVALASLAAETHGYVGADLAALCREAAMAALRRATARPPAMEGPAIADDTGPAPGLRSWQAADLAALSVGRADFDAALREVTPTALRALVVEVPDSRWSDVAGLDSLRDTLIRAVQLPLAEPEKFARLGVRPPRGVLLHGRPGTGKTLIARALANEAQAGFIAVRGPELLGEWQGASERALREIFARARMSAPCIVFFDEIDAIASRRGGGAGATVERMVAQLLTEMDGITPPGGVVVLAATNRVDLIDPALLRPGRFDLVLEMPIPDEASRASILAVHAAAMPLAGTIDFTALAAAMPEAVGADMAGLCRLAALACLARDPSATHPHVIAADFTQALRQYGDPRPWR